MKFSRFAWGELREQIAIWQTVLKAKRLAGKTIQKRRQKDEGQKNKASLQQTFFCPPSSFCRLNLLGS
jgi:hypothetical protein